MVYRTKIRVRLIILHEDEVLLEYVDGEDFYFYPGGVVENFETIEQAAIREMKEEINQNFEIDKILYVRDFIKPEKDEHSLELYILGKIDKYEVAKNPDDPDPKPDHRFNWFMVDELPDSIKPNGLTEILRNDFKHGFNFGAKYLGEIE